VHQPLDVRVARRLTRGRNPMSESCGDWAGDRAAVLGLEQSTDGVQPSRRNAGEFCCAWDLGRVAWCGCRLPLGEILGVPVLVPVRASPVPSVVRGITVVSVGLVVRRPRSSLENADRPRLTAKKPFAPAEQRSPPRCASQLQ